MFLTGEVVRAARAMARLEQAELARASGLSLETVKRLEAVRGVVNANMRTIEAIYAAFEAVGVLIQRGPEGRICVCQIGLAAPPWARLATPEAAEEPVQ